MTYTVADAYSGYIADVTYSGEARYDAYKPSGPVAIAAVPRPAAYPAPAPLAYAPRPIAAAPYNAPRVIAAGPYRPAPY